jgi:hypothetical protein
MPVGTELYSPISGVVVDAYSSSAAGRHLKIRDDQGYLVEFKHLNDWTVKPGDRVERGQLVAYSGNTGRRSTGPHLHVELTAPDGSRLDPYKYFAGGPPAPPDTPDDEPRQDETGPRLVLEGQRRGSANVRAWTPTLDEVLRYGWGAYGRGPRPEPTTQPPSPPRAIAPLPVEPQPGFANMLDLIPPIREERRREATPAPTLLPPPSVAAKPPVAPPSVVAKPPVTPTPPVAAHSSPARPGGPEPPIEIASEPQAPTSTAPSVDSATEAPIDTEGVRAPQWSPDNPITPGLESYFDNYGRPLAPHPEVVAEFHRRLAKERDLAVENMRNLERLREQASPPRGWRVDDALAAMRYGRAEPQRHDPAAQKIYAAAEYWTRNSNAQVSKPRITPRGDGGYSARLHIAVPSTVGSVAEMEMEVARGLGLTPAEYADYQQETGKKINLWARTAEGGISSAQNRTPDELLEEIVGTSPRDASGNILLGADAEWAYDIARWVDKRHGKAARERQAEAQADALRRKAATAAPPNFLADMFNLGVSGRPYTPPEEGSFLPALEAWDRGDYGDAAWQGMRALWESTPGFDPAAAAQHQLEYEANRRGMTLPQWMESELGGAAAPIMSGLDLLMGARQGLSAGFAGSRTRPFAPEGVGYAVGDIAGTLGMLAGTAGLGAPALAGRAGALAGRLTMPLGTRLASVAPRAGTLAGELAAALGPELSGAARAIKASQSIGRGVHAAATGAAYETIHAPRPGETLETRLESIPRSAAIWGLGAALPIAGTAPQRLVTEPLKNVGLGVGLAAASGQPYTRQQAVADIVGGLWGAHGQREGPSLSREVGSLFDYGPKPEGRVRPTDIQNARVFRTVKEAERYARRQGVRLSRAEREALRELTTGIPETLPEYEGDARAMLARMPPAEVGIPREVVDEIIKGRTGRTGEPGDAIDVERVADYVASRGVDLTPDEIHTLGRLAIGVEALTERRGVPVRMIDWIVEKIIARRGQAVDEEPVPDREREEAGPDKTPEPEAARSASPVSRPAPRWVEKLDDESFRSLDDAVAYARRRGVEPSEWERGVLEDMLPADGEPTGIPRAFLDRYVALRQASPGTIAADEPRIGVEDVLAYAENRGVALDATESETLARLAIGAEVLAGGEGVPRSLVDRIIGGIVARRSRTSVEPPATRATPPTKVVEPERVEPPTKVVEPERVEPPTRPVEPEGKPVPPEPERGPLLEAIEEPGFPSIGTAARYAKERGVVLSDWERSVLRGITSREKGNPAIEIPKSLLDRLIARRTSEVGYGMTYSEMRDRRSQIERELAGMELDDPRYEDLATERDALENRMASLAVSRKGVVPVDTRGPKPTTVKVGNKYAILELGAADIPAEAELVFADPEQDRVLVEREAEDRARRLEWSSRSSSRSMVDAVADAFAETGADYEVKRDPETGHWLARKKAGKSRSKPQWRDRVVFVDPNERPHLVGLENHAVYVNDNTKRLEFFERRLPRGAYRRRDVGWDSNVVFANEPREELVAVQLHEKKGAVTVARGETHVPQYKGLIVGKLMAKTLHPVTLERRQKEVALSEVPQRGAAMYARVRNRLIRIGRVDDVIDAATPRAGTMPTRQERRLVPITPDRALARMRRSDAIARKERAAAELKLLRIQRQRAEVHAGIVDRAAREAAAQAKRRGAATKEGEMILAIPEKGSARAEFIQMLFDVPVLAPAERLPDDAPESGSAPVAARATDAKENTALLEGEAQYVLDPKRYSAELIDQAIAKGYAYELPGPLSRRVMLTQEGIGIAYKLQLSKRAKELEYDQGKRARPPITPTAVPMRQTGGKRHVVQKKEKEPDDVSKVVGHILKARSGAIGRYGITMPLLGPANTADAVARALLGTVKRNKVKAGADVRKLAGKGGIPDDVMKTLRGQQYVDEEGKLTEIGVDAALSLTMAKAIEERGIITDPGALSDKRKGAVTVIEGNRVRVVKTGTGYMVEPWFVADGGALPAEAVGLNMFSATVYGNDIRQPFEKRFEALRIAKLLEAGYRNLVGLEPPRPTEESDLLEAPRIGARQHANKIHETASTLALHHRQATDVIVKAGVKLSQNNAERHLDLANIATPGVDLRGFDRKILAEWERGGFVTTKKGAVVLTSSGEAVASRLRSEYLRATRESTPETITLAAAHSMSLPVAPAPATRAPRKVGDVLKDIAALIPGIDAAGKAKAGQVGSYDPHTGAIVMHNPMALGRLLHEIGHKLVHELSGVGFKYTEAGFVELEKTMPAYARSIQSGWLWRHLVEETKTALDAELIPRFSEYGSAPQKGQRFELGYKRLEGLAVAFESYLRNPGGTAMVAPRTVKLFEQMIPSALRERLLDLAQDINAIEEANAIDRVALSMESAGKRTIAERLREGWKNWRDPRTWNHLLNGFVFHVLDSGDPASRVARRVGMARAARAAGKHVPYRERFKYLSVYSDFDTTRALLRGVVGKVEAVLMGGVRSYYDGSVIADTENGMSGWLEPLRPIVEKEVMMRGLRGQEAYDMAVQHVNNAKAIGKAERTIEIGERLAREAEEAIALYHEREKADVDRKLAARWRELLKAAQAKVSVYRHKSTTRAATLKRAVAKAKTRYTELVANREIVESRNELVAAARKRLRTTMRRYKTFNDKRHEKVAEYSEKLMKEAAAKQEEMRAKLVAASEARILKQEQAIRRRLEIAQHNITGIGLGEQNDVVVARRALEEAKRQYTPEEFAAYRQVNAAMRDWGDALLQYMHEGGRIGDKELEDIRADNMQYEVIMRDEWAGYHRPMGHLMDPEAVPEAIAMVSQPIKEVARHPEPTKDPVVALARKTKDVIYETDRNRTARAFRDLLVESDPLNLVPGSTTQGRVGRRVAPQEAYVSDGVLAPNILEVFVPKMNADNVMTSVREYWKLDPDVYASLNELGHSDMLLLDGLFNWQRKFMKTIIYSPQFALRNLVRDYQTRAIVSMTGNKKFGLPDLRQLFGGAKVTAKTLAKPDAALLAEWMWNGGNQAGYVRASANEMLNRVDSVLRGLLPAGTMMPPIRRVSEILSGIFVRGEQAGRLAEYENAKQYAKKQYGATEAWAAMFAAAQSRGLADFAVAGHTIRRLSKFVWFLNPAIQGTRRSIRAMRDDPVGTLVRWTLWSLLPATAEWMLHAENDELDEWRQLPSWRRYLFYNFKAGDTWISIPRAHELGVTSGVMVDWMDKGAADLGMVKRHPKSVKSMLANTAWASTYMLPIDTGDVPSLGLGTLGAVPLGLAVNREWYTGNKIVPEYELPKDPELRKSYDYGSWIGRQLARGTGVGDSRQWDYFLRGLGGNWYKAIETVVEMGAPPARSRRLGRGRLEPTLEGFLIYNLSPLLGYSGYTSPKSFEDVQWVQTWLASKGKEDMEVGRGLQDLISAWYEAKSHERRQALTQKIVRQAGEMRRRIEAYEKRRR